MIVNNIFTVSPTDPILLVNHFEATSLYDDIEKTLKTVKIIPTNLLKKLKILTNQKYTG